MAFHNEPTISLLPSLSSKSNVLLIVPDDKYFKSTNASASFADLLSHDTDFKNKSLPEFDILEWKNKAIKAGSFEVKDYIELAKQISQKYLDYDGFVILDSISTIPYTASYLSFMLENLAKPVVLTGSHSSSFDQIGSDAKPNLLHSLLIAAYTNCCEVMVCFNKKLFRGNRIQRRDTNHDPFVTYNYPQLGEFAATDLHLSKHCLTHTVKKRFKTFTKVCPNIIVIHLVPQLRDTTLKLLLFSQLTQQSSSKHKTVNFFNLPNKPSNASKKVSLKTGNKLQKASKSSPAYYNSLNFEQSKTTNVSFTESDIDCDANETQKKNHSLLSKSKSTSHLNRVQSIRIREQTHTLKTPKKGVILSFFGVGNAPSRESFKNVLSEAMNKYECEIVVCCQPMVGGVDSSVYASGNFLSDLNLISAYDMTVECCVAKLAYLMGKGYRGKGLKQQFEVSLRGELTESQERRRRVVQHLPMRETAINNVQSTEEESEDEFIIEEESVVNSLL